MNAQRVWLVVLQHKHSDLDVVPQHSGNLGVHLREHNDVEERILLVGTGAYSVYSDVL